MTLIYDAANAAFKYAVWVGWTTIDDEELLRAMILAYRHYDDNTLLLKKEKFERLCQEEMLKKLKQGI